MPQEPHIRHSKYGKPYEAGQGLSEEDKEQLIDELMEISGGNTYNPNWLRKQSPELILELLRYEQAL